MSSLVLRNAMLVLVFIALCFVISCGHDGLAASRDEDQIVEKLNQYLVQAELKPADATEVEGDASPAEDAPTNGGAHEGSIAAGAEEKGGDADAVACEDDGVDAVPCDQKKLGPQQIEVTPS